MWSTVNMKRQTTLAKFGFTKKSVHRQSSVEVKIPNFAKVNERKIQCDFCTEWFIKEQGYSVHLKCKHGRYVLSSL